MRKFANVFIHQGKLATTLFNLLFNRLAHSYFEKADIIPALHLYIYELILDFRREMREDRVSERIFVICKRTL